MPRRGWAGRLALTRSRPSPVISATSILVPAVPLALLWCLATTGCSDPVAPDPCNSTTGMSPAAAAGCPVPRVTEGCKTTVSIRVSGGVNPQIDWTPACGMNHVMVRTARPDGLGGIVFWSLSAPLTFLDPGLSYGTQPPGALLEGPTRTLQAGTTYRISLEMIEDGAVITGQGTAIFTP